MQASVLGPASVDGVCGGSHARGNCMIALRLTRGYRKSGDDREWRRELASNLPPASRHPWWILTSNITPLSAVWLCPWRALRTCLDSVGVHSACTTAWHRWYKRREWTGRQLCCRCIVRWSWVSSAYWWHRTPYDAMISATGLQYTSNSSGPSTDPWATPTSRVVSEDRCCPSFTNCVRSCRYDWIQDSAVPDTLNSVCSRFISVEWQTVSKAAERSRPISNVTSLLSAAVWTLSRTSRSAVSVECPCL